MYNKYKDERRLGDSFHIQSTFSGHALYFAETRGLMGSQNFVVLVIQLCALLKVISCYWL